MSIIRTENLAKTYKGGTVALKSLDLQVNPAEVFGFIGPNGAGKSTTIQLLLNFIRPDQGSAFLFDQPVAGADHRKRLGYLPESVNLHTYYTGRRLLEFYAGLAGVPAANRRRRAEQLLESGEPSGRGRPQGLEVFQGHGAATGPGPGAGERSGIAYSG